MEGRPVEKDEREEFLLTFGLAVFVGTCRTDRTMKCSLLFVALLPLLAQAKKNDPEEKLTKRYSYKHSFKKPYFFGDESNAIVPHWETLGDVMVSNDYMRLTASVRSQRGGLWSEEPLNFDNWEIEMKLLISGRGRIGGDGLAFWYTKDRELGPVYGGKDTWDGLGVLFDTYDNDGMRNNPYILGVLNDGSMPYAIDTDGIEQAFGGCVKNFRNTAFPTQAKITFLDGTLTVAVDTTSRGKNYRTCFTQKGLDLPKGYYFGITAATGGLADDHDIFSFETWELNPPIQNGPSIEPVEEPDEETQEKLQKIATEIQDKRFEHMIEFDENYREMLSDLVGSDAVVDKLNVLTEQVSELKRSVANLESTVRNSNKEPSKKVGNDKRGDQIDYSSQFSQLQKESTQMSQSIQQLSSSLSNNQAGDKSKTLLKEIVGRLDDIEEAISTESSNSGNSTVIIGVVACLVVLVLACLFYFKSSDGQAKKFV
eukprot:Lithocolla_globosa_v1_NODE_1796_length_2332_cov_39.836627.p1 type:complete len:483 gc:universal NODE_1796_length_2332_cov_39.836627:596-2044(+)